MSVQWTTRCLAFAALWNILGGASALLDPAQHFALLYHSTLTLSDPLQLFFYRCTWINVIAWGLAYAFAVALPETRRAVLLAGALGKTAYFAASVALFLAGQARPELLLAGAVDLLLAVLFIAAFLTARSRRYPDEAGRPYITRL